MFKKSAAFATPVGVAGGPVGQAAAKTAKMNDRSVLADDLLERGSVFAPFVNVDDLRRRIIPTAWGDASTGIAA
jgi:hypothetical protein